MPKIYKRHCNYCGKYYESPAKKFCCYTCSVKFKTGRAIIDIGISKDELEDLFIVKRFSISEIAKQLGVSRKLVITRLQWWGIKASQREKHPRTQRRHLFDKANNWKGGVKRPKNGYVRVLYPDHPRASSWGYVPEHRLIWEKHNKKLLPDGWVIHHLNSIKDDNRIENLEAMPQGKHHSWLYIQALQKRIQELEEALIQWSPLAEASIDQPPKR